ncbi:Lysine-specific demethylase 4 [Frankliniella fusca]|uniref:Lysine-specific demethylase 4 n=1 Tax=Frankliniella fusca TaxID=407009 RepID=A0AAE1I116_9NEOP|nr:Lysine-specific demethylase 4 [Frankliniella fusca]
MNSCQKSKGIGFSLLYQTIQMPGELIVLDHQAFHQGFAMDFSVCEAINFGRESWKDIARSGTYCSCDGVLALEFLNAIPETTHKRKSELQDTSYTSLKKSKNDDSDVFNFDSDNTETEDPAKSVVKKGKVTNPLQRGRKALPTLPPAARKGKSVRPVKDDDSDEDECLDEDERLTEDAVHHDSDTESDLDPELNKEQQETNMSSKMKMQQLPYPKLSEDFEIIKCFYTLSLEKTMSEKQAKSFQSMSKTILGYAHMFHPEDENGFVSLADFDKLTEFINILTHEVKLSASTIKCYCENIRKMMQFVEEDLFENEKFVKDLEKFPTLADNLKKAKRGFAPTAKRAVENSHLDVAARQTMNADSLPDDRCWDGFLADSKDRFESCLERLEKANDDMFAELEKQPGASELRPDFNFVVGYIAVSHILISAAIPSEFANCSLAELFQAKIQKSGDRIIHVALHKTGENEQATILVKNDMWPYFARYNNIMKRFKKPKKYLQATIKKRKVELAFPYASTTGFSQHHCVYKELNRWCDLNKKPHFTANLLRKVAETFAEYEESEKARENVRKGLHHSKKTASGYYKKLESKVVMDRKQAVENTINLSKAFSLLRSGDFPVDVYSGRLNRSEFDQLMKTKVDYYGENNELYELYCEKWLELAEPKVIEDAVDYYKGKDISRDRLEAELEDLLQLDDFIYRKADIKRAGMERLNLI